MKITKTDIKNAREFYGIYDYVCDGNVISLINSIKNHGIDWVKEHTKILKVLSYKSW